MKEPKIDMTNLRVLKTYSISIKTVEKIEWLEEFIGINKSRVIDKLVDDSYRKNGGER